MSLSVGSYSWGLTKKLRKKSKPAPIATSTATPTVPKASARPLMTDPKTTTTTTTTRSKKAFSTGSHHRKRVPPPQKPLTRSPDLSHNIWKDYVLENSQPSPMETSPPRKHTRSRSPRKLFPEFAHLAVDRHHSHPPRRSSLRRAASDEELAAPLPWSPATPETPATANTKKTRRHAKTPVFWIGQLEGRPDEAADERTDVEKLAEEYRALLRTRSFDFGSVESLARLEHSGAGARSVRRSPVPPRLALVEAGGGEEEEEGDKSEASPTTSDDGTLVEFQDDAIYFKPSFSAEALTPVVEDGQLYPTAAAAAAASSDALGMHICVDLLARELSSAVQGTMSTRSGGGGGGGAGEMPSLQVWLMIEAYERLRDRVLADPRLPVGEADKLQAMFDGWLEALYRVHEGFAQGSHEGGEADALRTSVDGE